MDLHVAKHAGTAVAERTRMHSHRNVPRYIRALLALAVVVPLSARAQEPAPDEEIELMPLRAGERVEFSLEDGDLGDLVRMITRVTGRQFVITGNMREVRASVMSTEPITAAEAYRVFLAILHQNGLTVVRRGRHYTVELSEHVERAPIAVLDDDDPLPFDERFVTWIHRVRHVPVADASQVLESLRSPDGQLVTYAPTQALILVDTGANIRRMRRILEEIDVERGNTHVWIERIHFGDAATIAEQLTTLFAQESAPRPQARAERPAESHAAQNAAQNTGAPSTAVQRFIAEPRTNSIIIVATEEGYLQVIALLREIDQRGGAEATVRVERLQHGDAANIAATLSALLEGAAGENAGAAPIAGLRGRVRVEAHADLNALVITATPGDYNTVRQLIRDLDAPPRQVFLEMVFMELTVDHGDEIGTNILSGLANLAGPGTVGVITGGAAPVAEQLLTGLSFFLQGPSVSDPRIPGGSAPSFGVMVQALARSNQANILSTPSILVLDNREAVINVGQNVPLQGSSVPSFPFLPGVAQPEGQDPTSMINQMAQQSSGRRDTGIIVHATPHINDDGEIRLEIQAEDSRAGEVSSGNLAAVALHQSIAETELVIHDGETVVIGGLMRDSEEMRREGVPGLSEIPILGALFGRTERHTVRRNLLFFVTPYIVRGPSDMRAIYERRMRERREFLDRYMVFEGDDWEPPVDYNRTRGLVAEMLDTVIAIDAEIEAARVVTPDQVHHVRPPIDLSAPPPR
jgi:general secretion pathway protein D